MGFHLRLAGGLADLLPHNDMPTKSWNLPLPHASVSDHYVSVLYSEQYFQHCLVVCLGQRLGGGGTSADRIDTFHLVYMSLSLV